MAGLYHIYYLFTNSIFMKLNFRLIRSLFVRLLFTLFLISIVWVLVYRWLPPPATLHMFLRRATAGKKDLPDKNINYKYVSIERVSEHVPLAMIAAEDQLFLKHKGFDFEAIEGAYKRNRKSKRIAGGSTISQQVAKNAFLWQGRSYLRKAVEAYFTVLIELLWSKKRIMEVYLNIAEMGDRIFGINAAARIYFNKSPENLTPQQAALIASVLPNPIKYKVKQPSAAILRKRHRVMRNMRQLGGTAHVKSITNTYYK
jgi:monofunctional biosynthetic peptidoglycan transglycosylase